MTNDKLVRQLETELHEVRNELNEFKDKVLMLNNWVLEKSINNQTFNEKMSYLTVLEKIQNDFRI